MIRPALLLVSVTGCSGHKSQAEACLAPTVPRAAQLVRIIIPLLQRYPGRTLKQEEKKKKRITQRGGADIKQSDPSSGASMLAVSLVQTKHCSDLLYARTPTKAIHHLDTARGQYDPAANGPAGKGMD